MTDGFPFRQIKCILHHSMINPLARSRMLIGCDYSLSPRAVHTAYYTNNNWAKANKNILRITSFNSDDNIIHNVHIPTCARLPRDIPIV